MHETGMLGKLIPEFNALTCKVEYDSYHEFTIDQHTLIAVANFDNLGNDENELIRHAYTNCTQPYLLRLALLLHDIGKALPGNHSTTGALIAQAVCERLGFSDKETERVVFLIRQHLELSRLAFRREPEERILADFRAAIGDLENLDMLYLLTVIDIRSVGNHTWTHWKGIQLTGIYQKTRELIENEGTIVAQDSVAAETASRYARLKSELSGTKTISFEHAILLGFEELALCANDRPHLFADLAGCLSSEGYSILNAQIHTFEDGGILDTFHIISDGSTQLSPKVKIENFAKKWQRIATQQTTAQELVDARTRQYPGKPTRRGLQSETIISCDNSVSENYSVIEVRTPDRPGLLFTIATTLCKLSLDMVSAKLSTRIDRAVDVFYVRSINGGKITSAEEIERIKKGLEKAL